MPYRTPLNECSTLSVVMVAHFGRQLLEVVQFLHGQNVAHCDLKPENVVVDLHTAQLFIIDYNLAMFVDGRNEVVHGYVGTNSFTAPEVGDDWKESTTHPSLRIFGQPGECWNSCCPEARTLSLPNSSCCS